MRKHTHRLTGRSTLRLMINGAEVHIRRRSRGRLVITADSVEAIPKGEAAPVIDPFAEFAERTNAELEALLIGIGVDPPARATKATLLGLLREAAEDVRRTANRALLDRRNADEEE